jgi:hypothetical protein
MHLLSVVRIGRSIYGEDMLDAIRVYKSEHVATTYDDGRPRLFSIAPDFINEPMLIVPFSDVAPRKPKKPWQWCVLVHPSRWDAFWMAVNQPDVFAHPEVQGLLGWSTPSPASDLASAQSPTRDR